MLTENASIWERKYKALINFDLFACFLSCLIIENAISNFNFKINEVYFTTLLLETDERKGIYKRFSPTPWGGLLYVLTR